MKIFSKDMLVEKNTKLPDDYQEVKYIESTNGAYIDTGINGNGIGTYEITFDPIGSARTRYEQYFAGDRSVTNATGKIYYNSATIEFYGGTSYVFGTLDGGIYRIEVTNDAVYSNGEFIGSYTAKRWGDLTFYVFNSHSETNYGASMRLYKLIMYSDGIKVRDYVPCYRKSDTMVGLYDLVSQQFVVSANNMLFTKGPDV